MCATRESDEAAPSGGTYWRALQPYADAVSIYDGPAVFQRQFARLPEPVGVLFAAQWLDTEVRNGGFEQFFYNSTGILAPEAYSAFRTLKLEDAAALIQSAMSVFGAGYPRDRSVRCQLLEGLLARTAGQDHPFEALETRYYELVPLTRFETAADSYASRINA